MKLSFLDFEDNCSINDGVVKVAAVAETAVTQLGQSKCKEQDASAGLLVLPYIIRTIYC